MTDPAPAHPAFSAYLRDTAYDERFDAAAGRFLECWQRQRHAARRLHQLSHRTCHGGLSTHHMEYGIRHITRFRYHAPVSETVMEIRLHPRTEGMRRCLNFALRIRPEARGFAHQDYLGNIIDSFDIPVSHSELCVAVQGYPADTPPEESCVICTRSWSRPAPVVENQGQQQQQ
jgi:hypothetical protein